MDYRSFILECLSEAATIANSNFGKVMGTTKKEDSNQVLSQTDVDIGQMIINNIKKTYPDHNIIDEEAGVINNHSNFTWVIDPIDGTSNFVVGTPMYGVIVGLLDRNIPVVGGVALPYFHEIYTSEKGKGSYCNKQKIQITNETDLTKMLVSYGIDGHQDDPDSTQKECTLLADIVLAVRNIRADNSVFDQMMVARGKYGAWLNQTTKIWDNVATHLIIEEAGGVFTDFFGNHMDYSHPLQKAANNFTVCAGVPLLHKQLQEIIYKNSHISL